MTRFLDLLKIGVAILLMAALWSCVQDLREARAEGGVWMPILSLYLTTPIKPLDMMSAQFPERFASKKDCSKFTEEARPDLQDLIDSIMTHIAMPGSELLHHALYCIQDTNGQRL